MDEEQVSSSTVASSSDNSTNNPSQIVLACEIPLNQVPGTVFHVRAPDDRFFEVGIVIITSILT